MDFLMNYGIWILLVAAILLVLSIPPGWFFYKWMQLRKYVAGDYIIFWRINPGNMHAIPKIKRWDRNRIHVKKTIPTPEGDKEEDFWYFTGDGKPIKVDFPLFQTTSLLPGATLSMGFWVDGDDKQLDVLADWRARESKPLLNTDNAAVVQAMRKEESAKALMVASHPDALKGMGGLKPWMVGAIAGVIILAVIVLAWQFNSMGDKLSHLTKIVEGVPLP